MPFYFFVWDEENIEHLEEHGVSTEEFEAIVSDPEQEDSSRSSGRPMAFGFTADGRLIACVFERIDDATVYPVTAFEIED